MEALQASQALQGFEGHPRSTRGQASQASQEFEGHPCSDAQAHQSKANEGAGLTGLTGAGAHAQGRSLHCKQCKDGFRRFVERPLHPFSETPNPCEA